MPLPLDFLGGLFANLLKISCPESVIAQVSPNTIKRKQVKIQASFQALGVQDFNLIRTDKAEINTLILKGNMNFVNGNGKLIARLDNLNGLPSLIFYDPRDAMPRMQFYLDDKYAQVSYPSTDLMGFKGNQRIRLGVNNVDEPYMTFWNAPSNRESFKIECMPNFGTQLYLSFSPDAWSMLQSHVNNRELVLSHGKAKTTYSVVVKN
ncbi:MAG: hypothetical protein PWR20_791 [Bacteroidales bacterium]|nr:hypothetical protein [Bacteroidales bacterium]MDN5329514.1 hypothetical protein [Bacteroidales bacterium]